MSTMKYENSRNVSVSYDEKTGEVVIRFTQGDDDSTTHTFKTFGIVAHEVEGEPRRSKF